MGGGHHTHFPKYDTRKHPECSKKKKKNYSANSELLLISNFLVDFTSVGGCNPHQIEPTANLKTDMQSIRQEICFCCLTELKHLPTYNNAIFAPFRWLNCRRMIVHNGLKCKVYIHAVKHSTLQMQTIKCLHTNWDTLQLQCEPIDLTGTGL